MRIPELIGAERPSFSFEFFPPRTAAGVDELLATIERLSRLEPSFVSVTYGAAGSTRDGTVEVATRIKRELGVEAMAHLSCVGETVDGLEAILERLGAGGIENVLALRGDPPRGEDRFTPPEGGLRSSPELARLIRDRGGFAIGASSFPEVHPEAASPEADIAFLAKKVDAGVEFLITQLFFENAVFVDWLASVRAAGIEVPVIAGLMPIRSYEGIRRFCSICDAAIPEPLEQALAACEGDVEAERELGIAYAARQAEELLGAGVDGLHFYTLNKADSTLAVLGALRAARPRRRAERPAAAP